MCRRRFSVPPLELKKKKISLIMPFLLFLGFSTFLNFCDVEQGTILILGLHFFMGRGPVKEHSMRPNIKYVINLQIHMFQMLLCETSLKEYYKSEFGPIVSHSIYSKNFYVYEDWTGAASAWLTYHHLLSFPVSFLNTSLIYN